MRGVLPGFYRVLWRRGAVSVAPLSLQTKQNKKNRKKRATEAERDELRSILMIVDGEKVTSQGQGARPGERPRKQKTNATRVGHRLALFYFVCLCVCVCVCVCVSLK